jgi:polyferredoxin
MNLRRYVIPKEDCALLSLVLCAMLLVVIEATHPAMHLWQCVGCPSTLVQDIYGAVMLAVHMDSRDV